MPQAQQLGRYQLLDRISFGGMAEIFRAKTFDAAGGEHLVAVKRVLAHLVEDDEFLQMLIDEAKLSALLRHENIAQIYEFARAGQEYFLAMEYVDGKDLRAVMERVRAFGRLIPIEHVAWVAMQTALGLHAAHTLRDSRGHLLRVVHRDVSPSNLLCSYRGEVKLCDFGIAKATLTRIQTRTGVIKGKVRYMSPEQAMGRRLDHRSDLFSLGTVLYEALALTPPFSAPSEVELIFAVRGARRRPVTDHRPEVPAELGAILDRAMSRSRSGRYQSGAAMAVDLRAFLDRHVPGYGRGHFAQFMRQIFQGEIEQELRQLEAFELDRATAAPAAENLIADALAPDAPFTRFTANPLPAPAGSDSARADDRGLTTDADDGGLHVEPTRLFGRGRMPLPADLHDGATSILEVDAAERALADHDTERQVQSPLVDPIHDETTQPIRQDGGEAEATEDLDAIDASEDEDEEGPFPGEPTMLLAHGAGSVDRRDSPPPPKPGGHGDGR
jgi:hypothetical protein